MPKSSAELMTVVAHSKTGVPKTAVDALRVGTVLFPGCFL